jgi:hypothetical protein
MRIFVFAGSTLGSTRTASSILLAAGATGLGLEPLHIQVLTRDRLEALPAIKGLPFATASIAAERGERITERIRARARRRSKCSLLIVDMPAQDVLESLLMLGGLKIRILVPVTEWATDPGQAVQDYRRLRDHWERWEELNSQGGRRLDRDAARPRAWLLPVGWPAVTADDDLLSLLRSQRVLPVDDSQYQVLYPGLPRFDSREMDLTDGNDGFALTERQLDASARIAWPLCGDIVR